MSQVSQGVASIVHQGAAGTSGTFLSTQNMSFNPYQGPAGSQLPLGVAGTSWGRRYLFQGVAGTSRCCTYLKVSQVPQGVAGTFLSELQYVPGTCGGRRYLRVSQINFYLPKT